MVGCRRAGRAETGHLEQERRRAVTAGYRRATTVGSRWAVMMGGNGGQHAGRHGPQAAALLVPQPPSSPIARHPSRLLYVPVPPVTTGRQPTVATCHHPPVTISSPITSAPSPHAWHRYHRFRLDGDGELHTYRWSSVPMTAHHLASRLALEPSWAKICANCENLEVLHTKFPECQFLDGILWTKIRGRFADKEMGMKFCGQVFADKDLQTKLCG